ncbi:hypothetical protein F5Y17DRAFT_254030 [Xylariaceae sp. FL0594]|nr:hypothetical protein F5Y17DRAFT_254030 [Xylariaceae sp. FL0594]
MLWKSIREVRKKSSLQKIQRTLQYHQRAFSKKSKKKSKKDEVEEVQLDKDGDPIIQLISKVEAIDINLTYVGAFKGRRHIFAIFQYEEQSIGRFRLKVWHKLDDESKYIGHRKLPKDSIKGICGVAWDEQNFHTPLQLLNPKLWDQATKNKKQGPALRIKVATVGGDKVWLTRGEFRNAWTKEETPLEKDIEWDGINYSSPLIHD